MSVRNSKKSVEEGMMKAVRWGWIFRGDHILELGLSEKEPDNWETVLVVNRAQGDVQRIMNEDWGAS